MNQLNCIKNESIVQKKVEFVAEQGTIIQNNADHDTNTYYCVHRTKDS